VQDLSTGHDTTGNVTAPLPPAVVSKPATAQNGDAGFCLPDKEDSPAREAVVEEAAEPPSRKPPPKSLDAKAPSEAPAKAAVRSPSSGNTSPALHKEAGTGAAASPTHGSGGGTGDNPSTHRKSLVLDGGGRRRISPKQLVEADNSGMFVCPICAFVIARPVITSCSHLFCEACFRHWVTEQVSKQKKSADPGAPVPLVPCPQSACTGRLRKQDIQLLDKADTTKVGAVALLQRLRNNLRVRCVHHVDHFKLPFGQDAERIHREAGLSCEWVGDIMAYDEHVRKGCQIENRLMERAPVNGTRNSATPTTTPSSQNGASPKAANQTDNKGAKAPVQKASPETKINGGGVTAAVAPPADGGEVRVAQYDYVPRETDKAQIPLRKNDFVRVFEITDSGWAAGVRLCRDSMQEVGEAGWFPEGYLFPLTGSKKDQGGYAGF
jgi:hypothetical protein